MPVSFPTATGIIPGFSTKSPEFVLSACQGGAKLQPCPAPASKHWPLICKSPVTIKTRRYRGNASLDNQLEHMSALLLSRPRSCARHGQMHAPRRERRITFSHVSGAPRADLPHMVPANGTAYQQRYIWLGTTSQSTLPFLCGSALLLEGGCVRAECTNESRSLHLLPYIIGRIEELTLCRDR